MADGSGWNGGSVRALWYEFGYDGIGGLGIDGLDLGHFPLSKGVGVRIVKRKENMIDSTGRKPDRAAYSRL